MAHLYKKNTALQLRAQGATYSQIKQEVGVSKSTLSRWLREFPLEQERLRAVQAESPERIGKFRQTMRRKREMRLQNVMEKVAVDIGLLSGREILIAGFFLYWGEGGKTDPYRATITNTDPTLLRFAVRWFAMLGVPKGDLRIRLQLYPDMDAEKEQRFWCRELGLSRDACAAPYIKKNAAGLIYKGRFGHGTCDLSVAGRDVTEYVHCGVRYLQEHLIASLRDV